MCIHYYELSFLRCYVSGSIVAHADHCSDGWRCPRRWVGSGLGLWPSHCRWVNIHLRTLNWMSQQFWYPPSPPSGDVKGLWKGMSRPLTAVTNPVVLDQWLRLTTPTSHQCGLEQWFSSCDVKTPQVGRRNTLRGHKTGKRKEKHLHQLKSNFD